MSSSLTTATVPYSWAWLRQALEAVTAQRLQVMGSGPGSLRNAKVPASSLGLGHWPLAAPAVTAGLGCPPRRQETGDLPCPAACCLSLSGDWVSLKRVTVLRVIHLSPQALQLHPVCHPEELREFCGPVDCQRCLWLLIETLCLALSHLVRAVQLWGLFSLLTKVKTVNLWPRSPQGRGSGLVCSVGRGEAFVNIDLVAAKRRMGLGCLGGRPTPLLWRYWV